MRLPCYIAGKEIVINVDIINTDIPVLLSLDIINTDFPVLLSLK